MELELRAALRPMDALTSILAGVFTDIVANAFTDFPVDRLRTLKRRPK